MNVVRRYVKGVRGCGVLCEGFEVLCESCEVLCEGL